jgi:hypothetical protein
MAFVPEGQADRSQARSAWVVMQKRPVPGTCLALSDIILVLELVLVPDVFKAGRFPGPQQKHLPAATFKERVRGRVRGRLKILYQPFGPSHRR